MVTCGACGRENPADARFCNACGSPLAAVPESRREERKVVSVLFADLVGFTSRSERLDPEDVRALLAPYWAYLRDELERFGGTVEKFIGDAVMALFGAPVAHEDDPERAVRAALAIRDWVRDSGEDLQVRIAVNSGEALVLLGARPGEGEGMATGDVVNTAARLQAAAPVNGVLVGDATYRATRHVIEYGEAPPVVAKGKADPLVVWEAQAPLSRATTETVSRAPLVGRQAELDLLIGALQRVRRERRPQLVTVAGVPGIGKSRLVAELFAVVDADEALIAWRRGRSLAYGEGVSLWALGEIVKAELGVLESDARDTSAAKLAGSLAGLLDDVQERAWVERHLAPLLGLPAEESGREERFAAWRRWIEALAERRPLVLVFEDLQWADDELLDFVDELVDWVEDVPLLVLCTTRPELFERRLGWSGGKRNALTISLGPLPDADTARVVAAALDQALLPAETQAAVLARAGGNPLYAEQYARMVTEGVTALADLPDTVHGVVAARLDLLSPDEKRLLQDAAVVGRVFWPGALGEHAGLDELLRGLTRKEFVRRERRSAIAGEHEYSFAHALVRDVAYAQIPRGERSERHRATAVWFRTLPPDRAADRAEMVAHHYAAALELGEAAGRETAPLEADARRAFREAGDRAAALHSLAAAEEWFSAALALWPEHDPELGYVMLARADVRRPTGGDAIGDAEQAAAVLLASGDRQGAAEAEISAAGSYWIAGRGAEASEHAARAAELVAELPPSPVKAEVACERARLLMLAGRRDESIELATEALALSEAFGLERLQSSALITRGAARSNRDESAEDDLVSGVAIAERVGYLAGVHRGLNNLGEYYLQRGRLRSMDEIYERIDRDVEQFGLAVQGRWIAAQDASLQLLVGNWDRAVERANTVIDYVDAGGTHYLESNALFVRGWIRRDRGEPGASEDLERALEAGRRAQDPQNLAPILAYQAATLALERRTDEARRVFAEVRALCRANTGMLYCWGPPFTWAFANLGAADEYREILAGEPASQWLDAALAICDGDFVRAADVYAAIEDRTDEAEARIRAAGQLQEMGEHARSEAQLARALAFYRSVGASARIREAEALLPASA